MIEEFKLGEYYTCIQKPADRFEEPCFVERMEDQIGLPLECTRIVPGGYGILSPLNATPGCEFQWNKNWVRPFFEVGSKYKLLTDQPESRFRAYPGWSSYIWAEHQESWWPCAETMQEDEHPMIGGSPIGTWFHPTWVVRQPFVIFRHGEWRSQHKEITNLFHFNFAEEK